MIQEWIDAKKTICIDFNGVLDTYTGWQGPDFMYPPRPGLAEFLTKISKTYKIVVLTSTNIQKVKQWLCKYRLDDYIDDVTDKKVPAIVYLDDRALTFNGDFDVTFDQIVAFKTYWEPTDIKTGEKG